MVSSFTGLFCVLNSLCFLLWCACVKRNSDNRSNSEVAASLMTVHDAYASANKTQIFSNRNETNFVLSGAMLKYVRQRNIASTVLVLKHFDTLVSISDTCTQSCFQVCESYSEFNATLLLFLLKNKRKKKSVSLILNSTRRRL